MSAKKAILLTAIICLYLALISAAIATAQATSAQSGPASTTINSAVGYLPVIQGHLESPYKSAYLCQFDILAAGPRTMGAVVTPMDDGQVFISGGQETASGQTFFTTKTYAYNPTSRNFTLLGFSDLAHHSNATLLNDGRVIMFAGGPLNQGSNISLPEIYDPQNGEFSIGGQNVLCIDAPYTFPDNDVLLICRFDNSSIDSFAQIYDPLLDEVNTFDAATFGSFLGPFPLAFSLPYEGNKALVTDSYSAAIFDKQGSTPMPIDGLVVDGEVICGHPNAAIGLAAGQDKVYESGGFDDFNVEPEEYYADACILDLATFSKQKLPDMALSRSGHAWVGLPGGEMAVIGGQSGAGHTGLIEIYDPAANRWQTAGELNFPRSDFAALLLDNGEMLIFGGQGGGDNEIPPPEIGRCQRQNS